MKSNNTFGVHFVLRSQKADSDGKIPVYARITVNGTSTEFSMKFSILKKDWNSDKGAAKPSNPDHRQLNSYLQEVQAKLHRHYRELRIEDAPLTAQAVKEAFLGIHKKPAVSHSLLWLVSQHELMMGKVLKPGTMKNYRATESYLQLFLANRYKVADMPLKELNYEFISGFEYFVRNNSLKENDPCTTNGTMKHLERLKKMATWAVKNEWLDRNPFSNFRLKFKHTEREFLFQDELDLVQTQIFDNPMLERVKNLFLFGCYTGLSYIDLVELRPHQIITGIDKTKWIKTTRAKTDTPVNVPLLTVAETLLEKFTDGENRQRETIFPRVTNQEVNGGYHCRVPAFLLSRFAFNSPISASYGTSFSLLIHTALRAEGAYDRAQQDV